MEKKVIDRIEIRQGDITRLDSDAIVNAANNSLLGGGGVDGAIHKAAGPELLEECKTRGGCPTGEAAITMGYNLPAQYVIHTVGPVYKGKPEDSKQLSLCYLNSLQIAADHGISSIAFPAVSCGAYGYPIDEACKIAIDSTCDFLKNNQLIKKVIFVLFSEKACDVYKDYLATLTAS